MDNYYISFPQATSVYEDSWSLIKQMGGQNFQIGKSYKGTSIKSKILRLTSLLLGMAKFAIKTFKNDDAVFLLIPYNLPLKWLFYNIVLHKKINLYLIMIDLSKARDERINDEQEKKVCNKAKAIMAQTELMKNEMISRGYSFKIDKNKIFISHFWPIFTKLQPIGKSSFGDSIAFSGALYKAPFASMLPELDKRLQFVVNPQFRMITEDWGLVWDGKSVDTCSGEYGDYMKIVYPYKASLYLASNRPLIVWKESGIADFVIENHLGIAIGSLYEIHDAIHSLTDYDKKLILQSVATFCNIIRTGSDRIKLLNQMITLK